MATEPTFITIGTPADKIDVLLSYRIVELFSEGLYASPNKAIEELVANSFDAGALRVLVLHSANMHDQDATIAVIDDGEGMGIEGLKKHWLIGVSDKRALEKLPKGRQQIGQFGIGKLATYVLADCLTHITKSKGKYYSTTMNYTSIDKRVQEEVEPKKPIKLVLRELTEAEAKTALARWTVTAGFKKSNFPLFGKDASASWTVAIMSSLKKKVHDIKPGMLEWVLRTALPLRPDFGIWLNGKKLTPSKQGQGLIQTWVLGKDLGPKLPKPGPKGITLSEDAEADKKSEHRFGLEVPGLGRVTGYAEAYKDLLTGKSEQIFRSYGFFVFIRGRLINVLDGHFGIDPNELRHGTFGRFRLVINIDSLDDELRANRETVREGTKLEITQNLLWGIFNFVRPHIDRHDADELPGVKLARNLAGSPGSLSRQPIIELARAVVAGRTRSRYLIVPKKGTDEENEAFIEALEKRAETPENFVTDFSIDWEATSTAGFARYDTSTGAVLINGWHPFVTTFQDEFLNKKSRQPLEVLALSEVLLEAHLHSIEVRQDQIDELLNARDQLLRTLANQSGRQSPFAVAHMLLEKRNNPDGLEDALCAAFTSLGCDVRPYGGKGKPDGVAIAILSGDGGKQRTYSVMLESKSKEGDTGKIAAGTVDISAVIRHRDDQEYDCDHALVLGRDFPTTQGEKSALAKEIAHDRKTSAALGQPRTITLITIDDLAELVRLRPLRQIGLAQLRGLFECALPDDSRAWIAKIRETKVQKVPYKKIVETIEAQQKKWKKSAVKYSGLREALSNLPKPVEYQDEKDLVAICVALAQISERTMFATPETVELDQSAHNVIEAIEASMREYDDLPTHGSEKA